MTSTLIISFGALLVMLFVRFSAVDKVLNFGQAAGGLEGRDVLYVTSASDKLTR